MAPQYKIVTLIDFFSHLERMNLCLESRTKSAFVRLAVQFHPDYFGVMK